MAVTVCFSPVSWCSGLACCISFCWCLIWETLSSACQPLPEIPHGQHTGRDVGLLDPGTSVNYSCDLGYSLIGEETIHCTAEGVWEPAVPHCKGACGVDFVLLLPRVPRPDSSISRRDGCHLSALESLFNTLCSHLMSLVSQSFRMERALCQPQDLGKVSPRFQSSVNAARPPYALLSV